jgi:hypothetical protein
VIGSHLFYDHRVAHRGQNSAKRAIKELDWPRIGVAVRRN